METKYIRKDFTCVKVGDIVTVMSDNARHTSYPKEFVVKSKGRKYITIENVRGITRFNVEDGFCSEWGSFFIYPGTIGDYEKELIEKEIDEFNDKLKNCEIVDKVDELFKKSNEFLKYMDNHKDNEG